MPDRSPLSSESDTQALLYHQHSHLEREGELNQPCQLALSPSPPSEICDKSDHTCAATVVGVGDAVEDVLLGKGGKLASGQGPVTFEGLRGAKGPAGAAPPFRKQSERRGEQGMAWHGREGYTLILDRRDDTLLSPVDVGGDPHTRHLSIQGFPRQTPRRPTKSALAVAQQLPDLALGAVGELVDALLPALRRIRVVPPHLRKAGLEEGLPRRALLVRCKGAPEFGHVVLVGVALQLVPGRLGMGQREEQRGGH